MKAEVGGGIALLLAFDEVQPLLWVVVVGQIVTAVERQVGEAQAIKRVRAVARDAEGLARIPVCIDAFVPGLPVGRAPLGVPNVVDRS